MGLVLAHSSLTLPLEAELLFGGGSGAVSQAWPVHTLHDERWDVSSRRQGLPVLHTVGTQKTVVELLLVWLSGESVSPGTGGSQV